jgi:hypothetical protein
MDVSVPPWCFINHAHLDDQFQKDVASGNLPNWML